MQIQHEMTLRIHPTDTVTFLGWDDTAARFAIQDGGHVVYCAIHREQLLHLYALLGTALAGESARGA